MKKQDKGFTLVELLIVIVILGILATVTVFAVRGITDRGQTNACEVEERALRTAIESYYVDNDRTLPTNLDALSSGSVKYIEPDASLSTRWTYTQSSDTLTAVGKCATPTTT